METKLPFEKLKTDILVKREAKTDNKYGQFPEQRTTKELLNYGVICLNKMEGPSSHQVSDYVKQVLKVNKAGHGGSLDPNVTGVLPIALGNATKIMQTLLTAGKEYVCLMYIHKELPEEKIKEILNSFVGKITQLPPIRSAVKREYRQRKIYYIEILDIKEKDVLFKVGCEAGTYIRRLCLHPKTEIVTSDGLISIEEIYKNKQNLLVFSYHNGELIKNKIIDFQRIPFSGELIEIRFASGILIKVTPDHKLLASTKTGPKMIESKELTEKDFIFRSITLPKFKKKIYISELLDEGYLIHDLKIKEKCKEALITKYGSIREMYRQTKFDRKPFLKNSKIDIRIKHLKSAGIFDEVKSQLTTFKTEKGKIIETNPELTVELLYLIGLIVSDGNNTKEKRTIRHTRVVFSNTCLELINLFASLTKKIFPNIKVSVNYKKGNTWEVRTSNSVFATVCANLGVISPSEKGDFLRILNTNEELIAAFLKGYLDGDGGVDFNPNQKISKKTQIRFFTSDFINAKRVHQMLLMLGIQNKIFRKIKGTKQKEKKIPYNISISDPGSKIRFLEIISSDHPKKRKRLELIRKYFEKNSKESGDYLYCPIDKLNEIKEEISLLRSLGGNISRVVNEEKPMTRYLYKRAASQVSLSKLSDDFCIEQIKSIKRIPYQGFVYDITVENDHNFLIENGIVSSNCDDFGKKAGFGAHMKQLVRTKAGPFRQEDWCSLHDLKDAFYLYEKGDDTELRKLIKSAEFAVGHLPKIWVTDTTVDTLCHGANLSIPGISKLHSNIRKGDLVAIFTLKEELICLGNAKLEAKEIIEKEKGIAVITTKVFMEANIYPKFKKIQ